MAWFPGWEWSENATPSSRIHCAGQLRDERCYEAFAPEVVERVRPEFVLGSHTGGGAVRATLERCGVVIDAAAAREMAARVRAGAAARRATFK